MSSKNLTKYLLLPPGLYLAFCAYKYYFQIPQLDISNGSTLLTLQAISSKIIRTRSSSEYSNLLQSIQKDVMREMLVPSYSRNRVIDFDMKSQDQQFYWWMTPYMMKTHLEVNNFNEIYRDQTGLFALLLWINTITTERMILKNISSEKKVMKKIIDGRDKKCWQIARKNSLVDLELDKKYFECLYKTEKQVRSLQKDLQKLDFIESYHLKQN